MFELCMGAFTIGISLLPTDRYFGEAALGIKFIPWQVFNSFLAAWGGAFITLGILELKGLIPS